MSVASPSVESHAHVWWLTLSPLTTTSSRDCPMTARRAVRARARESVRLAVATTIGAPAANVEIHRHASGRPEILIAGRPAPDMSVSASYAGDRAAAVVYDGGAVGIDIEDAERELDIDVVVRMFFTSGEADELAVTPPARARHEFFQQWTWKEAVLKAAGTGLRAPLPLRGGAGALLDPVRETRLRPDQRHVGCLVTEQPRPTVHWHLATAISDDNVPILTESR